MLLQADLEKVTKRLQLNHDPAGTLAADMGEIATRMASNGNTAGEAFSHLGMQVDSIGGLLGESDEEVPEGDDDEEEEERGESASVCTGTERERWFDRDRSINAAIRQATKAMEKLKDTHKKKIEDLAESIRQVMILPSNEQKDYSGEVQIASVRLVALEKLLGTRDALDEFIKTFKMQSPLPPAQGAGGAGSSPSSPKPAPSPKKTNTSGGGLGNAPPSKTYEDLVLLAEIEANIACLHECTSRPEIIAKKAALAAQRIPVNDLLNAAQGAMNDIKKVKRSKEVSSKKITGSLTKPGANGKKDVKTFDLLNELMGVCQALRCLSVDEFKANDGIDFSQPFIVSMGRAKHESLFNQADVKRAVGDFVLDLLRQNTVSRSECAPPAAVVEELNRTLKNVVPDIVEMQVVADAQDPLVAEFAQTLKAAIFAIKKGEITFGCERNCQASIRVTGQGTRAVVLTPFALLAAHLGTASGSAVDLSAGAASRQRCSSFLRHITRDTLEEYIKGGASIFSATVGPHDMIYVPNGFFFGERVTDQGPCAGFRVPVFVRNEAAKDFAKAFVAAFATAGRSEMTTSRVTQAFRTLNAKP